MDKKIIIAIIAILVLAAGGLLFLRKAEEVVVIDDKVKIDEALSLSVSEAKEIAENWIAGNAFTYIFDGFGLTMESEEELAKGEMFSFVFSFESRAAGYGDRSEEMAAQVITPHTIEIIVLKEEVVSAITDGVYDEIKGEMIEEDFFQATKINLYFVQIVGGQEEIVGIERAIPYTPAPGRAAIEELLRGPFSHEIAEGLSSAINEGTELQSIDIQNGVASVDFNERLQEGVAGSARVMAIRSQIEKTLMQFEAVEEVIISINGRTEYILQP